MAEEYYEEYSFTRVLPVLFYEYLALAITRSLLPKRIVDYFGGRSYLAVGLIETVKGGLAFISCPIFGRLSDRIGRKYCLVTTVIGTTLPVILMVFTKNMVVYSIMCAISGIFSSTFPLIFAYISDCVKDKKKRAPAYGLALSTLGLSFCIGPIIGSYIAHRYGDKSVFFTSLILVIINVIYIVIYLPETVDVKISSNNTMKIAMEYLPNTWNLGDTFKIFTSNAFMINLAVIVFFYYTSVWALVSTLIIHITRHLKFSPVELGWFLSLYGLATMISEGILVRLIVPQIGEKNSMQLGLLALSLQCIVVSFATSHNMIYLSVVFSMIANLVYPSISSLLSKVVDKDSQGEALGSLNGLKALTEGISPLVFGFFMSLFENNPFLPGAPYLGAAFLSTWALLHCYELPNEPEYIIAKFNGIENGSEETEGW